MAHVTYPPQPSDRFEVYRFFNGIAAEGNDGLTNHRTRVPLVKSFLLEHVSSQSGRTPRQPMAILQSLGADVRRIDDTFLEVKDVDADSSVSSPTRRTVGYVEQYNERYFAFYTSDDSQSAKHRVNRWITRSPDLDATWFSGQLLQRLWDNDISGRGDDRYGKLTFKHESVFEMPEDAADEQDTEQGDNGDAEDAGGEDQPEFERRTARFYMADKIGRIRNSLKNLQENYAPLYALYGVRFPSRTGRGSHDLYQDGRITNRTESFEDHRNTVRYLYRTYRAMLDMTEATAWHRMERTPNNLTTHIGAKGVPLIVRFKEDLPEPTFKRWVSLAFQKRNRFRLWGEPLWLGPTKVHVYGADRHLWQPINIEMTEKSLVAILPQGTCGNTFHRLVTNIQAYVCPSIEAWLGSEPFAGLMDNSITESGGDADEH